MEMAFGGIKMNLLVFIKNIFRSLLVASQIVGTGLILFQKEYKQFIPQEFFPKLTLFGHSTF